jgi:hypothetical protein
LAQGHVHPNFLGSMRWLRQHPGTCGPTNQQRSGQPAGATLRRSQQAGGAVHVVATEGTESPSRGHEHLLWGGSVGGCRHRMLPTRGYDAMRL